MPVLSQEMKNGFTRTNVSIGTYAYAGENSSHVLKSPGAIISSTSGWIDAKYTNIVLQYAAATFVRSGNINLRVEGKMSSDDVRPASITTVTLTKEDIIDRLVSIGTPKMSQIRIGVRSSVTPASPLASPCVIYTSVLLHEAV